MDVVARRESPPMAITKPARHATPLMVFVKGIAGFAVLTLCLTGTGAAVMNMPLSPPAQLLATLIGGVGGAILVWHTRFSATKK
jgi:hypothetical protein